ncbi:MAG: type II toxin-antitoxin system RelE/ParE family toxin [Zoogloeaceae bacterium]|jgi:putative addiction module killer protein|nr:type II toxin-antitoxin system RelE/ParE family toxin [Zoogloeaceae bacterium]
MSYTIGMNTIETTPTYDRWHDRLTDNIAKKRIAARIRQAEVAGNFGDCEPVGEGVFEMRIHYGPGYRVYCKRSGRAVYVLLAGGDKSTQTKDIQTALKLARQLG